MWPATSQIAIPPMETVWFDLAAIAAFSRRRRRMPESTQKMRAIGAGSNHTVSIGGIRAHNKFHPKE